MQVGGKGLVFLDEFAHALRPGNALDELTTPTETADSHRAVVEEATRNRKLDQYRLDRRQQKLGGSLAQDAILEDYAPAGECKARTPAMELRDAGCNQGVEDEHTGEDEPRLGGLPAGRTIGGPDKAGAEVKQPDGPPEDDPVRAGLVNDGFTLVAFQCV